MSGLRLTLTATPSRGLMTTGLWINVCGHHEGDAAYQLVHGRQTDYLLIFTLAGEGWFRLGRRTYHIGAGDALLVPPTADHGYGTGSCGRWDILWVHMDGSTIPHLLAFWPEYPSDPCVQITRPEEMTRLLTSMVSALSDHRDASGLVAAGYAAQAVRLLILDARHGRAAGPRSQGQALAQAVAAYVAQHLAAPLTLADLAAHTHVSPAHLCRTFKRETGFSPLEYCTKQRINRAKELLQTTSHPIAVVARQVGYEDAAYFSRVFRAATGISPRDYRQAQMAWAAAPAPTRADPVPPAWHGAADGHPPVCVG